MRSSTGIAGVLITLAAATAMAAPPSEDPAPTTADLYRLILAQQQEIEALRQQISGGVLPPVPAAAPQPEESLQTLARRVSDNEAKIEATASMVEHQVSPATAGWWNRVAVGGYGSSRFEESTLDEKNSGFAYRRFVLALDAQPADRLQTYFELEFERFTNLELEKSVSAEPGEIEVAQAIEGTNESEISIEQAWARYSIDPALQVDMGALLVPLGRFNINHDDNVWVLPRRSLIDRGAPVLPFKAAWAELGAGVSGAVPVGDGLLDYQLYALNGASIDFELETELVAAQEDSGETELESKLEAEFAPSRGPFDGNANDSITFAGRVGLRPAAGHEIALSGYWGNYVPSYLGASESVWSVGIDGLHRLGGFEIEYEALATHFEGLENVASALASRALSKEAAIEGPVENGTFAKHEIEFTLAGYAMSETKTGYWVELRRPFWPERLNATFLGRGFSQPQLIPAFRMEQVYFHDQLQSIEFDGGTLTAFDTRNAHINRATLGLGYRPVPGWELQVAGEYTWTNEDSLAGLTNFLPAGEGEDDNFSFLLGVAFGF